MAEKVLERAGQAKNDPRYKKKLIGYIVALFFMFVLANIVPTWATVTRLGVQMLFTFIGILIIFITSADLVCGSFLGCIAALLYGYIDTNGMWRTLFGTESAVNMFVMMAFIFALTDSGAMLMLGRKLVRRVGPLRKVPIVFNILFMAAMAVCAMYLSPVNSAFMLVPLFEAIAASVGYKVDELYHKIMVTGMFMISASVPQSTGVRPIITGYIGQFQAQVPFEFEYQSLQFALTAWIGMFAFICLFCLGAKFIFRCDTSKLANVDLDAVEELKAENCHFNKQQIVMLIAFLVVVIRAFISSPFPKGSPAAAVYNTLNMTVMCIIAIIVTSLIKVDDKPVMDVRTSFKHIEWGPIVALGAMTVVAGSLTAEATGVQPWLMTILNPIYGNKPYFLFLFLILLTTSILTNLMSNGATCIIMFSVTASFFPTYFAQGLNPTPVLAAIVMVCFTPIMTYSASNVSPLYLNRKEIDNKFVFTTGAFMMLASTLCYTLAGYIFSHIMAV